MGRRGERKRKKELATTKGPEKKKENPIPFGVVNGGPGQHHTNARSCFVELRHKACFLVGDSPDHEDDDVLRTVRVAGAESDFL